VLKCKTEKGALLITIPISALIVAANLSEAFSGAGEEADALHVNDPNKFTQSVIRALKDEGEDGSNLMTRMLDASFGHVVEQGEEGFTYKVCPGVLDCLGCEECDG
jgi:hypothetical protein